MELCESHLATMFSKCCHCVGWIRLAYLTISILKDSFDVNFILMMVKTLSNNYPHVSLRLYPEVAS